MVGLLLVAVVSHGSPPVGDVVGGLVVLAGKQAGRRVPPSDGPVGGGEGRQQGPVDLGAVAGQLAAAAAIERQRGGKREVGERALDQGKRFDRAGVPEGPAGSPASA